MPPSSDSSTVRPGAMALAFAWAGGAAFAASLFVFGYVYGLRYGQPAAETHGVTAATLDIALFSLFALHHSILARTGIKRRVQRAVGAPLERSLYTWVASLLFLGVLGAWRPIDGTWYQLGGPARVMGYAAQAAGLWLTFRGAAALDPLDLAGVRQVLDARHGRAPRHAPLTTHGVYGLVRHPVYFGWALIVCGAPTMTSTRAWFAIVSTGYLALAIPWEERSLVAVFGDAYRQYQSRVRWRMLPGLW